MFTSMIRRPTSFLQNAAFTAVYQPTPSYNLVDFQMRSFVVRRQLRINRKLRKYRSEMI